MIMEEKTLRDRIAEIRWFHQIDLGNGVVTPGVDRSAAKLVDLGLPVVASFEKSVAWHVLRSSELKRT